MAKVAVNLAVSDSHMDRFEEVADTSRKAGLEIDQKMPLTGVISGKIEDTQLETLKKISGVEVEISRSIKLPDPGSEIQWSESLLDFNFRVYLARISMKFLGSSHRLVGNDGGFELVARDLLDMETPKLGRITAKYASYGLF
jgi:hypothetical protein